MNDATLGERFHRRNAFDRLVNFVTKARWSADRRLNSLIALRRAKRGRVDRTPPPSPHPIETRSSIRPRHLRLLAI